MNNADIADTFEQLADLLEIQNANPFRVRAYRGAARTLEAFPEPLTDWIAAGDRPLTDIPGIGLDLAEKIKTLVETGQLPLLEELRAQVPAGVLALLRIPGLGPKKVSQLYHQLGIQDFEQLRVACEAGTVAKLKGFGAKTQQSILQGIDLAKTASLRLYWSKANELAEALRSHMRECASIEQLELAGSYRRGKETVGDLDLLVVSPAVTEVMDHFGRFPTAAQIIARGDTKMSLRTEAGFQIDLRVVPHESFGAALQYFTGSKEHNVVLRGRAKQLGLKINEYGVFRVVGEREEYVAGATERDVYAAVGLPEFPPELREGRHEFEWAEARQLPDLITVADIQGDLHMHTTESDGRASLAEMVAAAQARGLRYIAITDHSQRVTMARGLNPQRLLAQWQEIDQLNRQLDGDFLVLKGIECDILEEGGMDLPDEVLAQADWVLASVHYGQQQSRTQITERILGAIEHPYVSAIAHPTGRVINRRESYAVDLDAVYEAASRHRKLLELNASPQRLDLDDLHCAAAKRRGIPIVINTDAHQVVSLDSLRYGILQARRAGLTKSDVANTRPWPELKKLIGR
jgi:DNA polymerase (family 10)